MMSDRKGLRPLTVYILAAFVSMILSQVFISLRTHRFENSIIDENEKEIEHLRERLMIDERQFRYESDREIEALQKEFNVELEARRKDLHEALSAAHGDIDMARVNLHQTRAKAESFTKQTEEIKEQNQQTVDHYYHLSDVATEHINDLNKDLQTCQAEVQNLESTMVNLVKNVQVQ